MIPPWSVQGRRVCQDKKHIPNFTSPGFCRTKILNYTQTSETNGKRKDCSETDLYKHIIYIYISVKIYIILIVLFYHNIITTCFVPHWIKHDTSNPVFSLFRPSMVRPPHHCAPPLQERQSWRTCIPVSG